MKHNHLDKNKSTEHLILHFLEQNQDKWLSGQALAERLNVTRNTIWRHINKLKAKGFLIETSTGLGYRLKPSSDRLDKDRIYFYLNHPQKYDIKIYDSVSSTNTLLKEKAKNNAAAGTVLVANSQMSGKGRLGRNFFSPPDTGVYFSLLLRPTLHFDLVQSSPALAAVALAQSLDFLLDIKTEIKWVNDIYLDGKKIAGILSEGELDFENKQIKYLVIGLGVNVYEPNTDFPEEFRERATYLINNSNNSRERDNLRNKIVATFLNKWEFYSDPKHHKQALEIFRTKNFLLDKQVEVKVQANSIKGIVRDISNEFELIIENNNQEILYINHGEATLHKSNS
ncbi:MAG: biotin--[acetyl-CoA-carboxylase] ligase [Clostridiaceae bacterium]|nr:biotin--[acetyl-CoA-carboxylase] ligase [Clostridiaceae bacterium]